MPNNDDPRGPFRQVVKIEESESATMITFNCGHVGKFNQIFHYTLGENMHCFQCGPAWTARTGSAVNARALGDEEVAG